MKKILFFITLLSLIFVPTVIFAQPNIGFGTSSNSNSLLRDAAKAAQYDENTSETTFAATLGTVVKILMSFSGIIFMSLTVYAGFLWMTARGEEAQVDKAKNIIRASVIGLVIAVSAYSITFFIVPRILLETAPSEESL
ncbi:MAG: hypothetical protein A2725_03305 [Candidatus Magasanikbacteria bacterium RIFCSPHIGHO2_01_FULL_33_34]|uniref:Uncharacterized protein n=1 Tax=Candidatus Magasanikbacteria bacterium RIFCSPHIGHO2_01_FULL_33_34 TaxID=1798671 RepID=A0A1F6LH34_9BACT|nr:MAG: hypothetical protein A2725_03305 [Candidatus Magasanikbacteria bacterium RIFCSPHIGHO2_01_FULL_33_34]OGH66156.1 MAG: hypothetical protein A3B83_00795 [Candidatus Magasanikbacteria bacterium RIFCSPHIGHO2_02_FULL_33_17]OGH76002.1 MAG: hypothetical protein A3A89_00705 [Candidatus Magasanikbacteria bacterium RIFCSPLOWO2_01_FULL_33_34]OGH81556.1 MAG: hypothetical protein A3F93_03270 [Candidatus Magasanikbacteria bacterium RIFCSPLOWO2_12_FULL_34_7]